MALNQINNNIWLGSIMSLRADKTLHDAGVTRILSVLSPGPLGVESDLWTALPIFKQMKHHLIVDIEDLDEVNIMEHFEKCNNFIQEAIDAKEGVLVHCVAGISRSASCVCAYLMRANKWTPEQAISYVQSRRPIANPNDGFREQLKIYYDCGFKISDNAKPYREWKLKHASHQLVSPNSVGSPVYTQVMAPPLIVSWKHIIPALLRRSGNPVGKANEINCVSTNEVIFGVTEPVADAIKYQSVTNLILISSEDKIPISPSTLSEVMNQVMAKMVTFRCKGCSATLASSASIVRHNTGSSGTCQHFFVEPVEWMRDELEKGDIEGKLACPKCSRKVGSYLWQGSKCSCGSWVTPSFKLSKAKIDEMATTARPLL